MPVPGGRLATWSTNMSSNSRNVKLPFLTTRCHYWGVDLPVDLPLDLPIWVLTVEMWNCYSWPLDATTGGCRSASRSANMSSNSRNVKLLFLTTRCHYWGVDLPLDLPIWALIVEMWNCHSWPLDASTSGGRSANWSANMSSSRNVKLPFLTTRCHYWGVDLPVDLPLDLPIWALTVEMWNYHSWPLDATTGGVDLPVDLICQYEL